MKNQNNSSKNTPFSFFSTNDNKIIVLTGGGTAGHVMPHLALLPDFKKHFSKIYYIGSKNGIEKTLIQKEGLPYFFVTTAKLARMFTLQNLFTPFKLIAGIFQAVGHLKKIKPHIIFSKGGFVSVPVVIAAKLLRVPVVSHESDITLGLANKINYRFSKVMCLSFSDTLSQTKKRGVYTGSAIRGEIFKGNKENIIAQYKLSPHKQTLLFVGGSLGAKRVNSVVFECANKLCKKYNVLHLTGKNNKNSNLENIKDYHQIEFASNIQDYFSAANCVISRAGSNVLFELLALKKPMLLIPLSKKASRGDQILNVQYFKKKGFAEFVLEENLNKNTLIEGIEKTLQNKNTLRNNIQTADVSRGNSNILYQILKYTK